MKVGCVLSYLLGVHAYDVAGSWIPVTHQLSSPCHTSYVHRVLFGAQFQKGTCTSFTFCVYLDKDFTSELPLSKPTFAFATFYMTNALII